MSQSFSSTYANAAAPRILAPRNRVMELAVRCALVEIGLRAAGAAPWQVRERVRAMWSYYGGQRG